MTKKISEFQAAVNVKMSPTLLRWFTSHSVKKNASKLRFQEIDGVYYYNEEDLENFNRDLSSPWPKPKDGTRPIIPAGIQEEVKKEAAHCCPVCRTNIGELAHIEAVVKTLNNHPHNLIYLCPNHHTVYDFGHKYNNVSRDDIDSYKKSLLIFQIAQWKLQGNLIHSYITAINLIGRIKDIENEILKCVSSEEFEKLFNTVINKIKELKDNGKQEKAVTNIIDSVNISSKFTNREIAYKYYDTKSVIIEQKRAQSDIQQCPICEGQGYTNYYETCPPCAGEGQLSKNQINSINFEQYELDDCPLCKGKGHTIDYETCPPCGSEGKLSKEQIRNIDFEQYELEDCPLCKGKGHTIDYETCPPCGGEGKLSKEQISSIDFEQYELEDCPLCKGKGHTIDYEICPPCAGEGKLSKEQLSSTDFEQYELEDCPLCKGKGHIIDYETCPPCRGEGKLSKEQIRSIDFEQYELEDCPLCKGKGHTIDYETCPPCGGEGKLSKGQIKNIDFTDY